MMWQQQGLFSEQERRMYTVSQVTARIRALLENEPVFRDLWVTGEVSNFSQASSGHVYLTLKDAGSQLGCVIWRSQARALTYLPRSGDGVVVHGRIGVYEQGGRYQLYIDKIQPAGKGTLFQEFERLKARLKAEGLFEETRKRPLPLYPQRIGVVTSPTAAAFRDVLNVLRRRYPLAEVLLSPTTVQGEVAPPRIVAALAALNARDDVDVILVVRGGGSLEDLWAFNEEAVARAVAASRLPVVSGVGHETDFTLTDFAADKRAPTPSAAAEVVSPDIEELRVWVSQQRARLSRAWTAKLDAARARVIEMKRTLQYLSPAVRLANNRQRVDDLAAHVDAALAHRLEVSQQRLDGLQARLEALNPHAVLERGYAIVRERELDRVVVSIAQARPGTRLAVQVQDGAFDARVESGIEN
jgi:exodeoxyribonuclease VII large subunit